MTDTSPQIERMVRDRIMAKTGEERFVIGTQMFDSARKMMAASLPSDLSETERRRELFRRTYGNKTGLEKLIWA